MRFALTNNVRTGGVTYTHALCSLAIAQTDSGIAVNVRRVLQRQVSGDWVSGPDAAGIVYADASTDPDVDGFLALVEDALEALLVAKGG